MGEDPQEWLQDRLQKTIVPSYKLLSPRKGKNPLTYLGILSFSCFVLLGISGVPLMLYYSPDFTGSYDSVAKIASQVPFGFDLRNVHYYASDVMILLALAHFFYLYFVGKYRYHNEVIWLTGLAFGVLAVLEAYTGYILVMNDRAMMAVDIGSGLLNSLSPTLSTLLVGASYSDLVLRVYTLHVVLIPVLMVLLVIVHFPRVLTVSLSAITATIGGVFVLGGLAPVALGAKFLPNTPTPVTTPEWYLSGIYAFLRTGAPAFIVGVFLPFFLLFAFSLLPFYDGGGGTGSKWRPWVVGLGAAVIAQCALITIWGSGGPCHSPRWPRRATWPSILGSFGRRSPPSGRWPPVWLISSSDGGGRPSCQQCRGQSRTHSTHTHPAGGGSPNSPPDARLRTQLRHAPGPQLVEIGLVIMLLALAIRISRRAWLRPRSKLASKSRRRMETLEVGH